MAAVPFSTLVNTKLFIPSTKTQYTAVNRNYLIDLLKPTLRLIYVDSAWYIKTYKDIAPAIEAGKITSAEEHYVTCGFYEHRMPYEILVDEPWYRKQYPDIDAAVEQGVFENASRHFYVQGFREGRMPHADFAFRMVGSA
jgi:hypothetical protein